MVPLGGVGEGALWEVPPLITPFSSVALVAVCTRDFLALCLAAAVATPAACALPFLPAEPTVVQPLLGLALLGFSPGGLLAVVAAAAAAAAAALRCTCCCSFFCSRCPCAPNRPAQKGGACRIVMYLAVPILNYCNVLQCTAAQSNPPISVVCAPGM